MSSRRHGDLSNRPSNTGQRQTAPVCPVGSSSSTGRSRIPGIGRSSYPGGSGRTYSGSYASRQLPQQSQSIAPGRTICPRPGMDSNRSISRLPSRGISGTCPTVGARPSTSASSRNMPCRPLKSLAPMQPCALVPSTSAGISMSGGSQSSLRPSSAPGAPCPRPSSGSSQRPTSRGSASGRNVSRDSSDGKLVKKVTSKVEKRLEQPPPQGPNCPAPPPTLVTTTTTVEEYFEPDEEPCPGPSKNFSQQEVSNVLEMVREEERDLQEVLQFPPPKIKGHDPKDYPLRKALNELKAEQSMTYPRESEPKVSLPPPDVPPEEMPPETMAQIMFSEEQGMKMDAPPDHLLSHLFPDRDNLVEVSSVAQGPMQDVVIPTTISPGLHRSILKKDEIHKAIGLVADVEKPTDSIFSDSLAQSMSVPPNSVAAKPKRTGKPEPLLSDVTPPWFAIDLEKMKDIIGASPARKEVKEMEILEDTLMPSETDPNSLEYYLAVEAPRHHSKVQLRGSQKPPWFPGYLIALPDIPEGVRLAKSPSAVLAAAWKSVQPNIFDESNISMA